MCICGGDTPIGFGATELWKLTRFGKCENRLQFRSSYLPVRSCYCDRTCTKMKPFPCTFWWSPHCWWHPIQVWSNPTLKLTIIVKDINLDKIQSPISPQQRRQWWWDSHQNDAHSIYFLMISILLVTSHTNLELYGFEVNYVCTISKYVVNRSPYLPVRLCYCDRTWSPFHVLCDDLHTVGDTPYIFGVIQLWSWL